MTILRKVAAFILAVLILISVAVVSAGAFTVVKDGSEYTFVSHTPTTGDCKVLIIRVGFADYPVDDEAYPADSEETLLSYFDGSEDSVNAYYEASSYGKLRLSCDRVFSYTVPKERDFCSVHEVLEGALQSLEGKIDFDSYDSNGDGYLDFVAYDFSGPLTGWGSTWWPHVNDADIGEVGGKKLDKFSLIRGSASVFIHEFGHILGAPDYYSYEDGNPNMIMTYDMMSNNTGDHDGFTKWFYGWLNDEDIAYVDKSSGDTTVTLAPIETPLGDGKKIAVAAPAIDRSKGFTDEFFIVEYDSGRLNSAQAFSEHSFIPGFRIFHVRGNAAFDEENKTADFFNSNDELRYNLIHNIKNELGDPYMWNREENMFREGDSLTPNGYPNTGFEIDGVYNGSFTGISFTDFVTGDNPSFKVSFTDVDDQNTSVEFSLGSADISSKINLTLTTDHPTVIRNTEYPENYRYAPYLVDDSGTKLTLGIKSVGGSPYEYELSYDRPEPTVQPDTKYTLVLPEGLFRTGYNRDVPEYRTEITTPQFLSLTVIGKISERADQKVHSNIFPVTDNSFGEIRVPYSGTGKCSFAEYNTDGVRIGYNEFELPSLNPTGDPNKNKVYGCRAYRLNDGNFALDLPLLDSNSFVKIDRSGQALSDVYNVSWELTSDYGRDLFYISYDLYKDGLCKTFTSSDYTTSGQLIIDFESEPRLDAADAARRYFNINSDAYAVMVYTGDRGLNIYDKDDTLLKTIPMPKESTLGVLYEDGKIIVLTSYFDRESDVNVAYAYTYSDSLELLERRDITASAEHIDEYGIWDRSHTNAAGYFLENTGDTSDDKKTVIAFDKDWRYLGVVEFESVTQYTFAGVCGLTETTLYEYNSIWKLISRFAIGDCEIVTGDLPLGDANLDGTTDITDATTVQRCDAKMTDLKATAEILADVDRDGEVSIIDATWIQRYATNMKAPQGTGKPL